MNKDRLIAELIIAGFSGDKRAVRKLASFAVSVLKKEKSVESEKISKLISDVDVGHSPFRSIGLDQLPQDKESSLSLLKVVDTSDSKVPIFSSEIQKKITRFIEEYKHISKLEAENIKPATSILLTGAPGVGKTLLASYIAKSLGKRLLVLDLATAVSSYLGKTGQNLKAVIDFAIETNSVLFLDEFDSIAKKRDDPSDLGELKRIVNILLKEIEDWPSSSLLVCATNHPELLDKAIWRRFDEIIEIPKPSEKERLAFVKNSVQGMKVSKQIVFLASELTEDWSLSDLERAMNKFKRRTLFEDGSVESILVEEVLANIQNDKVDKASICIKLHKNFPSLKLKDIAEMMKMSISTVHYHLKGKELEQ